MSELHEAAEEVRLVANILEKVAANASSVPSLHAAPLAARLRVVAEQLLKYEEKCGTPLAPRISQTHAATDKKEEHDADTARVAAVLSDKARAAKPLRSTKATAQHRSVPHTLVMTRASSVKATPIARAVPPGDAVRLSRDVAQVMSALVYNVLESTVRLVSATSATLFVRVGEEMVSICNVASRLAFPPQLVRHNCHNSDDAEVLASGVALNQRIEQNTQATTLGTVTTAASSALVFPVYAVRTMDSCRGSPIATLHVSNKLQGKAAFDARDEGAVLLASLMLGELLARVPQMNWMEHFYDPATLHIVAPFEPVVSSAAGDMRGGNKKKAAVQVDATVAPCPNDMLDRVERFAPEVVIRREVVPQRASTKPPSQGLSQMPTLRELSTYIENMQSCWKSSTASSVQLLEGERCVQTELRQLRRELTQTKAALTTANERLRLYELRTDDYKREYKDMRVELDTFFGREGNTIRRAT